MAAAEGGNIIWFAYTGEEKIPDEATHIFVAVKVIPSSAFCGHRNIVEVVCDKDVELIGEFAFHSCRSLRRILMPGVKIIRVGAFVNCTSLVDVECDKLEIVGDGAFTQCTTLRSIDLPSIRIVEGDAFNCCHGMTNAKFGSKLETIQTNTFRQCHSLERITIPLKNDMIPNDRTFRGCQNLRNLDLVEGALLQEIVSSLQLEEWRNDMSEEINSINQVLPAATAGGRFAWDNDFGEKALVIRRWVKSVLAKFHYYKAEHRSVLNEAATTLQHALPQDLVMDKVLSFLELSSGTFEGENHEEKG